MTDREKLKDSIDYVQKYHWDATREHHVQNVVNAARAHLETLPKTKVVCHTRYAVLEPDGSTFGYTVTEDQANALLSCARIGGYVVKLTGEATVPA